MFRILLPLILRRTKEVSNAQYQIELAVLRVDGFDFGKEVADGADC